MTDADITSPTQTQTSRQPQRQRCCTTWHYLSGIVLLLSPLLGFIISGIAILLLSVSLPSARRQWFLKFVIA